MFFTWKFDERIAWFNRCYCCSYIHLSPSEFYHDSNVKWNLIVKNEANIVKICWYNIYIRMIELFISHTMFWGEFEFQIITTKSLTKYLSYMLIQIQD